MPVINGKSRNVGRPLEASEAQCTEVLKLRKQGRSLRGIVDDTNLGLNTVRTIIAKGNGTDRTSKQHRERLEHIDLRPQIAKWKRQRRTGNALPKRMNTFLKDGQALIKEAKGLGK